MDKPETERRLGGERQIDVIGVPTLVLAGAKETGGSMVIMEMAIPPGYAPPPHRHSGEDEALYVVDGELEIEREGRVSRLASGQCVFLPRDRVHGFSNPADKPARVLVIASGGRSEACFRDFDRAARLAPLTPDTIPPIAASHGIEIVPPAAR
jgi:quercetin dioxygenase-like cupin family protein